RDAGLPRVVADEPVEALGLKGEQIGDGQSVRDLGEREAGCAATVLRGVLGGCGARSSQGKITSVRPVGLSSCRSVRSRSVYGAIPPPFSGSASGHTPADRNMRAHV